MTPDSSILSYEKGRSSLSGEHGPRGHSSKALLEPIVLALLPFGHPVSVY